MINGHDQELKGDGKTEVAIGVNSGRVIWRFPQAVTWVAHDPQNAFDIAEATARAAHEARFGTKAPSDGSYIAQQVKARVTEDLRNRMVIRAAVMMRSLVRQERDPDYIARQLVDTIFSEVDR